MFAGGEVEYSHSLFEEAIRLDPNCVLAWVWGGRTKIMMGDHHTAIKYCKYALRLSPLDPRALFAEINLAYAHFFLTDYEEALKCAVSFGRRHPNDLGYLRAAVVCNVLLGNTEAAKSLCRELLVRSPSDRVSETGMRHRFPGRPQDIAMLQEAYRIAGMPE
jgi:adenylate cyclase